ncbi:Signaling mucin MSB2 [Tolypocladium paradoxum]|uniref:Signaling mucin MSB2 n=1 Tax=Tolypocladium paradoxum TaxID=94208 RepID=A0A2S4KWK9_9HYPO|nr:Signaling mucin MSB2 [Tolypocladium paradoxum]
MSARPWDPRSLLPTASSAISSQSLNPTVLSVKDFAIRTSTKMHAKSIAVVSALAFAASAAAVAEPEAERPRIYYPRHVKREFSNSTTTGSDPASTPDNAATTTGKSSTSKRGTLGELFSDLLGPNPGSSSTTKARVTTVVIQSTLIITPTPGPAPTQGTGSAPEITVQPTTKKTTPTPTQTTPTRRPEPSTNAPESSTESGILIAPTGIVSSSKEQPTSSSDKGAVEPTSLVNSTSTDTQELPIPTTTTTPTGGILDPILTLISSLSLGPSSTNSTVLPTETSTPAMPTTGTTSIEETPTSETGILILPTLSSLLGPGPTTTTSPTLSSSDPAANATSTDLPVVTSLLPTSVTTDLPIITTSSATSDVPIVNSTSTGSFTGTAPTYTGTSTDTTTGTSTGTSSVPTDVPITNGTSSANSTAPVTTSLPITSTPVDNSTVVIPTTASSSTEDATTTASSSSTVVSTTTLQAVTSIRATATVSTTDNWLPTSIVMGPTTMPSLVPTQSPTGTSSKALPANILPDSTDNKIKPTPEGTVPVQIGFLYPLNFYFVADHPDAAGQIFKFLPQALADAGGFSVDKVQPSMLVPYDARNNSAYGYLITICKLSYPQNLVDKLQMDLRVPNSAIYTNADNMVRTLTGLINPNIDIHGGINDGGTGGPAGGAVPSSSPGSNNGPFDNGNQGEQSSTQKATTAGIAVGAVGLSVMYGAAMFMVARRYKRKRQAHRRSSSITNSQGPSEMRYTGAGSPALMGGALMSRDLSNYGGTGVGAGAGGRDSHGSGRSGAGNSGRTANISAPVAAENSLGWN